MKRKPRVCPKCKDPKCELKPLTAKDFKKAKSLKELMAGLTDKEFKAFIEGKY